MFPPLHIVLKVNSTTISLSDFLKETPLADDRRILNFIQVI